VKKYQDQELLISVEKRETSKWPTFVYLGVLAALPVQILDVPE
jgi:hypothetical protein